MKYLNPFFWLGVIAAIVFQGMYSGAYETFEYFERMENKRRKTHGY